MKNSDKNSWNSFEKKQVIASCIALAVIVGFLILAAFPIPSGLFHHQAAANLPLFDLDTEEGHVDRDHVSSTNDPIGTSQNINGTSSASTTQFVLMAFDGSKSILMWENTLNFAKMMNDKGTPVHFSYYINASYFLSKKTKDQYVSPTGQVGVSPIGFSESEEAISQRVVEVNRALREGHEIGSHTTGHNDGSKWTYDQWNHEFNSFTDIMFNIQAKNPGLKLAEQPLWTPDTLFGFRAPNLGVNANLYKVLDDKNFTYDNSGVARPFSWPYKDVNGLWHIPLGVTKNKKGGDILAMDYNWWYYQTKARDTLTRSDWEWQVKKEEVVNSYKQYFDSHYDGNHSPISIGHHFSLWNDGLYWEALKEFAEYACGKPNVKCVSHIEFVRAMEGKK